MKPKDSFVQANPEYSQSSYLRMRHLEESYQIFNYMDQTLNMRLQNVLSQNQENK